MLRGHYSGRVPVAPIPNLAGWIAQTGSSHPTAFWPRLSATRHFDVLQHGGADSSLIAASFGQIAITAAVRIRVRLRPSTPSR